MLFAAHNSSDKSRDGKNSPVACPSSYRYYKVCVSMAFFELSDNYALSFPSPILLIYADSFCLLSSLGNLITEHIKALDGLENGLIPG